MEDEKWGKLTNPGLKIAVSSYLDWLGMNLGRREKHLLPEIVYLGEGGDFQRLMDLFCLSPTSFQQVWDVINARGCSSTPENLENILSICVGLTKFSQHTQVGGSKISERAPCTQECSCVCFYPGDSWCLKAGGTFLFASAGLEWEPQRTHSNLTLWNYDMYQRTLIFS